jgi:uncharacterized phiE125 gp8 family phage protein
MINILTTTTAATNRQLVTLTAVKAELGITDTSKDAFIGTLIDQASAQVESYCARIFARQTYTQDIRLERMQTGLLLAQLPVVAVETVTEAGTELDPATDYEVNLRAAIIYRISGDRATCWAAGGKISVEYTAGYYMPGDDLSPAPAADEVLPADIQRVALELVKLGYFARDRDPTVSRESVPDVYDVSFKNPAVGRAIPLELAAALDPYRAQVFQ